MAAHPERPGITVFIHLLVLLPMVAGAGLIPACNGEGNRTSQKTPETVKPAGFLVEKSGSIQPGDEIDPNHAHLAYDAYRFEAGFGDRVTVRVSTTEFVPLLKLVEVKTGAVIAEWDSQYSRDRELTYTIAGPGEYEARVYALKGGAGSYSLKISIPR